MVLLEKGIICDSGNYTPLLRETENGTKVLTLFALMPRGGNTKKNYDVFPIKVFGRLAEDYSRKLANGALMGETVRFQLSIENNTNGIEFIATYIQFDLGEEILISNLPDFAKKKVVEEESKEKVEENAAQTSISEEMDGKETNKPSNVVTMETKETKNDEDKKAIENESNVANENDSDIESVKEEAIAEFEAYLHQAPIGVVAAARDIIKKNNIANIKKKVNGELADNQEYLIFREMMG